MNKKEKSAYLFAKEAHKKVKREGTNQAYIMHPVEVHRILKGITKDEDVLCAAFLHDVIEDTKYSYDDIKKKFGKRVADIVLEVSKDKKGKFNIKTREGLMVKLADILHNIHNSQDKVYIRKKINFVKKHDPEAKKLKKPEKDSRVYCKECKKYYPEKEILEKHWWNGDPDDPGDTYYTCPKEHQVDV